MDAKKPVFFEKEARDLSQNFSDKSAEFESPKWLERGRKKPMTEVFFFGIFNVG
jgi:hypothetical protein